MKLKDVAARGGISASDLENWLRKTGKYSQWVKDGFMGMSIADNADINAIINDFISCRDTEEEEARNKKQALANMLISSGFSFDGYTIVKLGRCARSMSWM